MIEFVKKHANIDKDIEFELRLYVDKRKGGHFHAIKIPTEQLFDSINRLIASKKPSPTFSIDMIHNLPQSKIVRKYNYSKDDLTKSKTIEYMEKKELSSIHINDASLFREPFKIAVSRETPLDESDLKLEHLREKPPSEIRIKLRFSIDMGDWRLDITFVKSPTSNTFESVRLARDKMFRYKDELPFKETDSIEVELENIARKVDEDSIKSILSNVSRIFDSDECKSGVISFVGRITDKRDNGRFQDVINKVIELNKDSYLNEIVDKDDWFLLVDKADGYRALVSVTTKNGAVTEAVAIAQHKCIDISQSAKIENIMKSRLVSKNNNEKRFVFDSELIEIKEKEVLILPFDVIMFDNQDVTNEPFMYRKLFLDESMLIIGYPPKRFKEIKPSLQLAVKSEYEYLKTLPYGTDGFIFTSKYETYKLSKNYKWKPLDKITIDFLCKKCPAELLGVYPYMTKADKTLYLLFVGITKDMAKQLQVRRIPFWNKMFGNLGIDPRLTYFPIQFSPSNNSFAYLFWWDSSKDLDNKIVELGYEQSQWKLYRVRDDKTPDIAKGYYGNNFRIAEMTWMNYFNPLTIEDMIGSPKKLIGYFGKSDETYYALRRFNGFVKEQLVRRYQPEKLVDLACGHGQDIFKYARANVRQVLAIDNDKMALHELLNRKYGSIRSILPEINIAEIDLKDDYRKTIQTLKSRFTNIVETGADMVVCHFAIHYFVHDECSLDNFASLVRQLVRTGGYFVYSSFDGNEITKLLEGKDEFSIMDDQKVKYSIKKKYKGTSLEWNQAIGVLLPFSYGQYYDEYMVVNDDVVKCFKKNGFDLIERASFSSMLDKYRKEDLTKSDIEYSKLQWFNIFQKK